MEQIPAVKRLVEKYNLPDDATEEEILRAVVDNGEKGLSREAGKLLRMISGMGVGDHVVSGYD